MGNGGRCMVEVVILLVLMAMSQGCDAQNTTGGLTRKSFPNGFVFGTASSAYQYEGAVKEDGRGPTIWDKFAHTFGKIIDFSNADVAVDQYHRFEEDIQLMADMGMDAYRFSIAWSRIFPNGTGEVNQAGIDHYNKLINALLAKGIEPYVTLYHWDLPQALEDKYTGWLDRKIINDYAVYAETCFKAFGDRVKHWITFNEPHTVAVQAYDSGMHAPGRCSVLLHLYCKKGNSGTEPYIVAHNMILSHATVSDIYSKKYKASQNGELGISFDVIWYEPMSYSTADIEAAKRAQEFQLGWFADPFFFGDYPATMRSRVGSRLPKFTEKEAALVNGSLDFMGINHYTTFYTKDDQSTVIEKLLNNTLADTATISVPFRNGQPIGDRANSIWLYIVPRSMRILMNYVKDRYNKPTVYITENGKCTYVICDLFLPFISLKNALKDDKRTKYHNDYLTNLADSIREDGCDVRGYFAWSLLDNWEWAAGYTSRFGLYYVDYKNQKRYPKNSVQWFKNLLASSS
uniref:Beta-glucosidase n=1 Tax=Oryza glumipatula TaxID=40148 RepID=A0A0E0B8Y5_9ORYZ